MYIIVRMNLYNFVFVQALICAFAQLCFFPRNWRLDCHREASPITTFSLIDQEIRAKSELRCVVRVAVGDSSVVECRQWNKYYQTGKTVDFIPSSEFNA